jgi:hypothetical protein
MPQQQQQQQQAPDQQQQAAIQAAALQQQFLSPFGNMMFMNPYIAAAAQSNPALAASPDMWAAMMSQQAAAAAHHDPQQQLGQQAAGLMNMPGAFPQPMFMPSQYPFFPTEGFGVPGSASQQLQNQQMMFFNAQQLQNYHQLQQLQYQNMALAQMQAQQQQTAQLNTSAPSSGLGTENKLSSIGGGSGSLDSGLLGLSGGASILSKKPNETSESDDLFQFNDLSLDSPAFDPKSPQSWMSATRR